MISSDVRFEGFDATSWTNLLSLFIPHFETASQGRSEARVREVHTNEPWGSLVIIHDTDGHVLNALHTRRGRIVDVSWRGYERMEELARRHGARRCVGLLDGALEELSERLAERAHPGDDYLTQWLVLLRLVRELEEEEKIQIWPRPMAHVPIPRPSTARRALDVVLPDGHALVSVVWSDRKPWTGLVVRRQAGAIDLLAGPERILRWTGPLGGDWRRDHRVITDVVGRRVAPVHLGVFSEASTLRALLRNPDPGAWARATGVRDIILQPAPPYAAVAVGADALRAVAAESARWFGGMEVLSGIAGPIGRYLRNQVQELTSVTSTLGFNPLRILAEAIRRAEGEDQNKTLSERNRQPDDS